MDIDFTTWRKGTRAMQTEKIDYCPQCGLKGSYRPAYTDKRGRYQRARYTHIGEMVNVGGLLMFNLKQVCSVDEREGQE